MQSFLTTVGLVFYFVIFEAKISRRNLNYLILVSIQIIRRNAEKCYITFQCNKIDMQ